MGSLWELWSEIGHLSDNLADPVLVECLLAGKTHRIFDDISDDNLKSVLSMINSLLNDPKNREKGATIFNELILTVNSSRLIGFQETLISALHLICRNLSSHVAQIALANFIPKCKSLPDVNQIVTSSIISKVMSQCLQELQDYQETQPGSEVIKLLQVCLETYRGPCGTFRERLEKALLPFIDHENDDLVHLICDLMPLMSATGGGGTNGEKHKEDWSRMVGRLISAAYDTLYLLYSDCCNTLEEENPFNRGLPSLELSSILQPKVLQRISTLKRRLVHILYAIRAYLVNGFPAAKQVPSRSILKLLTYIVSVNPVDLMKNSNSGLGSVPRKEVVFLAGLLPLVHISAFEMLNGLTLSIGANLVPDATQIEQIFSQEWKWLDGKKNAFENVRMKMYSCVLLWLGVACGSLSNLKTMKMWVGFLFKDVILEKEKFELIIVPKSKKEKKQFKIQALSSLSNTSVNTFMNKSGKICQLALEILDTLIPVLDLSTHKAVYQLIGKTLIQVYQSNTFPCPYDEPSCRKKLHKCLVTLATSPNPRSSVSLALILNTLQKGSLDPVVSVSSYCRSNLSMLERIIHPACPSMNFPNFNLPDQGEATELQIRDQDSNTNKSREEEEDDEIECSDIGCQTESVRIAENDEAPEGAEALDDDEDSEEEKAPSVSELREIMKELRSLREALVSKVVSPGERDIFTRPSSGYKPLFSSRNSSSLFGDGDDVPLVVNGQEVSNGGTKRKNSDGEGDFEIREVVEDGPSTESSEAKKVRMMEHEEKELGEQGQRGVSGGEVSEELSGMLQDFVDEGPEGECGVLRI